jgi:hypothetical protein
LYYTGVKPGLSFKGKMWVGVFETRVLRRIFGAERQNVTGDLRNFHNAEFRYL